MTSALNKMAITSAKYKAITSALDQIGNNNS